MHMHMHTHMYTTGPLMDLMGDAFQKLLEIFMPNVASMAKTCQADITALQAQFKEKLECNKDLLKKVSSSSACASACACACACACDCIAFFLPPPAELSPRHARRTPPLLA